MTHESVLDNIIVSDAKFQAFVQGVEAALLASGFLEVAPDTGQINPLTVARPAINTYAGFRIYRAKDAMAATKPHYIKVEYGVGSVVDRPRLQRTCSTSTNGAGTLTGQISSAANFSPSSTGSGNAVLLGSGGESHAWVMIDDGTSSTQDLFWITGRLVNMADGSSDDPVTFDMLGTGVAAPGATYAFTDGATPWQNNASGFVSHVMDLAVAMNSGGNASDALLFQPQAYRDAEAKGFPMMVGKTTELPFTTPSSSAFGMACWGGFHTFMPIPMSFGSGNNRICVPWE